MRPIHEKRESGKSTKAIPGGFYPAELQTTKKEHKLTKTQCGTALIVKRICKVDGLDSWRFARTEIGLISATQQSQQFKSPVYEGIASMNRCAVLVVEINGLGFCLHALILTLKVKPGSCKPNKVQDKQYPKKLPFAKFA
jgi:hypothetical protein